MSEDTPAVVETTSGKIEGIFRRGLYAFRGVPYAAGGKGRSSIPSSGRRGLAFGSVSV